MIEQWAAALEATQLASALRNSVWSYPLVNAAHILGIALLVGSIVPLDLRLLGAWSSVPLAPLWRVLTRTGTIGFIIATAGGFLLFITRASEYVAADLFRAKMLVIGIGVANVLILHKWRATGATQPELPTHMRLAAIISLGSWLTALTLGRLVGYF